MSDLLRLDGSAIEALADSDELADLLQDVGDRVAENAAQHAPKNTGAGAASIHAEVDRDDDGLHADVSWDEQHFYMMFAETGTQDEAPRPFLRPALDSTDI